MPTASNPADLVSRGSQVSELEVADLWWSGPKWLADLNSDAWPTLKMFDKNNVPELKPNISLSVTVKNEFDILIASPLGFV